jgi:hypothetical protein
MKEKHGSKASIISSDVVQTVSVVSDLADAEIKPFRLTNMFHRHPLIDPDAVATKRSVYDDPHLAPHYWPGKNYENLHRFDPTVRWTYREERVCLFRFAPDTKW